MPRLSVKKVAKLLSVPGRHGDGQGLYLLVSKIKGTAPDGAITVRAGSASWIFRYERMVTVVDAQGNERRKRGYHTLGIGSLHTFDLDEARERARKARQLLADGIDPVKARKGERAQQNAAAARQATFRQCCDGYFRDHQTKWAPKQAAGFQRSMRVYVLDKLGSLPVSGIDTGLVLGVLKRPVEANARLPGGMFWEARHETASRVRQRIEAVIDWAKAHSYCSGDNPAQLSVVSKALPDHSGKAKGYPSMAYGELPAFMVALREREGIAARGLEFTILTAARTNETTGATWDEIDLAERTWRIGADRMKGRAEHRVALSDRAVEILKSLPRERGNPFVFIGPKAGVGLSNMAMASVLKRMGRTDVTVHGFRSTFRTWGEERTNYPHAVLEMALAHVVDDDVVRAYRRTDLLEKRRRLADEWARYCCSAPVEGKLLDIRKRA